jgi:aspartate aminotransferase
MPSISRKGQLMPASPIRKLVPYAEKAEEKGVKVIYLNIGQPDIKTPEVALTAIKNYQPEVIAYSHSAGFASYRKKLAAYYQKLGLHITGDDVIITTGGSEALQIGFNTCFDAGDELIIPEPFYANYLGFSITSGINVVPVISGIDNGFALPPAEEFEKHITPRTKGILICNPANPTGYLYSREELRVIADIVKKHNLYLFADEVYREFCYDGAEHVSILEFEDIAENVVVVDSVSKRYSMCGARVGALISKNRMMMATALKFAQARLSPPSIGQTAGEAALETPASYFTDVITEYVARRNVLVEGLNSIPGVKCPKPGGAFYCMAELPVDDADKFAQWMLSEFHHEGHTVMMAPGNGFYSNPEMGKKQVRLAYVLEIPLLHKAVACLRKALEVYPGSTR